MEFASLNRGYDSVRFIFESHNREVEESCIRNLKVLLSFSRSLGAMALSGRLPSPRAVAAAMKLSGRRLERRWPFLPKAEGRKLNLGFDDLLEFQYARSPNFTALVIGAFDGSTNDPVSGFLRRNRCRAIFVEPQPGPFQRMSDLMSGFPNTVLLNAAIDKMSGARDMYCVAPGIAGLPTWTEQLASFSMEHVLKHEDMAPGLSRHIVTLNVQTLSFDDVLSKCNLQSLDLLQIDAEGMDAQLLAWFPFHRIKPRLLHYETTHMSPEEHGSVNHRLRALGYTIPTSDYPTDEMAILF